MGRLGEARLDTSPSATVHVLSPIVLSARHRRLRRPRWGTAGHGVEPRRSCSAQRHSAPPAAVPTGNAGRGPWRKLPGTTWPSHTDSRPTGTRAVSGLRELMAGAHVKLELAPQGATGRGLGWSRGPQLEVHRILIHGRHGWPGWSLPLLLLSLRPAARAPRAVGARRAFFLRARGRVLERARA